METTTEVQGSSRHDVPLSFSHVSAQSSTMMHGGANVESRASSSTISNVSMLQPSSRLRSVRPTHNASSSLLRAPRSTPPEVIVPPRTSVSAAVSMLNRKLESDLALENSSFLGLSSMKRDRKASACSSILLDAAASNTNSQTRRLNPERRDLFEGHSSSSGGGPLGAPSVPGTPSRSATSRRTQQRASTEQSKDKDAPPSSTTTTTKKEEGTELGKDEEAAKPSASSNSRRPEQTAPPASSASSLPAISRSSKTPTTEESPPQPARRSSVSPTSALLPSATNVSPSTSASSTQASAPSEAKKKLPANVRRLSALVEPEDAVVVAAGAAAMPLKEARHNLARDTSPSRASGTALPPLSPQQQQPPPPRVSPVNSGGAAATEPTKKNTTTTPAAAHNTLTPIVQRRAPRRASALVREANEKAGQAAAGEADATGSPATSPNKHRDASSRPTSSPVGRRQAEARRRQLCHPDTAATATKNEEDEEKEEEKEKQKNNDDDGEKTVETTSLPLQQPVAKTSPRRSEKKVAESTITTTASAAASPSQSPRGNADSITDFYMGVNFYGEAAGAVPTTATAAPRPPKASTSPPLPPPPPTTADDTKAETKNSAAAACARNAKAIPSPAPATPPLPRPIKISAAAQNPAGASAASSSAAGGPAGGLHSASFSLFTAHKLTGASPAASITASAEFSRRLQQRTLPPFALTNVDGGTACGTPRGASVSSPGRSRDTDKYYMPSLSVENMDAYTCFLYSDWASAATVDGVRTPSRATSRSGDEGSPPRGRSAERATSRRDRKLNEATSAKKEGEEEEEAAAEMTEQLPSSPNTNVDTNSNVNEDSSEHSPDHLQRQQYSSPVGVSSVLGSSTHADTASSRGNSDADETADDSSEVGGEERAHDEGAAQTNNDAETSSSSAMDSSEEASRSATPSRVFPLPSSPVPLVSPQVCHAVSDSHTSEAGHTQDTGRETDMSTSSFANVFRSEDFCNTVSLSTTPATAAGVAQPGHAVTLSATTSGVSRMSDRLSKRLHKRQHLFATPAERPAVAGGTDQAGEGPSPPSQSQQHLLTPHGVPGIAGTHPVSCSTSLPVFRNCPSVSESPMAPADSFPGPASSCGSSSGSGVVEGDSHHPNSNSNSTSGGAHDGDSFALSFLDASLSGSLGGVETTSLHEEVALADSFSIGSNFDRDEQAAVDRYNYESLWSCSDDGDDGDEDDDDSAGDSVDEAELDRMLEKAQRNSAMESRDDSAESDEQRQRRLLPVHNFRNYYVPEGFISESRMAVTYKVRERRTRRHFAATFVLQDPGYRLNKQNGTATTNGATTAEDAEAAKKLPMSLELRRLCAMSLLLRHPNLVQTFDVFYRNPADAEQLDALVRTCTGAGGDVTQSWGVEIVQAEAQTRSRPTVSLRLPAVAAGAQATVTPVPPRPRAATAAAASARAPPTATPRPRRASLHSTESNLAYEHKRRQAEGEAAAAAAQGGNGNFIRRWFPSLFVQGGGVSSASANSSTSSPTDAEETPSELRRRGESGSKNSFRRQSTATTTSSTTSSSSSTQQQQQQRRRGSTGSYGSRINAQGNNGVRRGTSGHGRNNSNAMTSSTAATGGAGTESGPARLQPPPPPTDSPVVETDMSHTGTVPSFQWPAEAAAELAERERRVAEMRARRSDADRARLAEQRAKIEHLATLLVNNCVATVLVSEYVKDDTVAEPISLWEEARRNRGLPVTQLMTVTRSLADALQYLHHYRAPRLAIVHGAVEPRNLLIGANGVVKLVNYANTHWWYMNGTVEESGVSAAAAQALQGWTNPAPALEPARDMYGLGCTLLMLTSGLPLAHAHQLFCSNAFPLPEPSMYTLLRGLLEENPEARLTAETTLQHPFVTAYAPAVVGYAGINVTEAQEE